jgi:Ca2+-binding EF-hand superfamily protein
MHLSLRLAVAALAAFAALVSAQTRTPSADVPLASARSSRDAEALFQRLDTDHDGVLSAQELAAPGAGQGNWIAVDRNGDGRITREEFGIVSNFAANPPSAATGGTQGPEKESPKASGRP